MGFIEGDLLAKWLSVRLRTKRMWVRVPLQSPVSSKAFLDIQAIIECGFTLKRVHGMIITYSQCNNRLLLYGKLLSD